MIRLVCRFVYSFCAFIKDIYFLTLSLLDTILVSLGISSDSAVHQFSLSLLPHSVFTGSPQDILGSNHGDAFILLQSWEHIKTQSERTCPRFKHSLYQNNTAPVLLFGSIRRYGYKIISMIAKVLRPVQRS